MSDGGSPLFGSFGGCYSFISDPCRYMDIAAGLLDQREFRVGESEVDGVGSSLACYGSPAGFLVGHKTDYTVKQKTLDGTYLMLYDKCMTTSAATPTTTRRFEDGEQVKTFTPSGIATSGTVIGYDEGTDSYLIEWGSPAWGVPARIWTSRVRRLAQ